MNIMKTNMLLLDNKFIKNEVENPTTVSAPVPSATEDSKEGMNALMAQGMMNKQNLAFQGLNATSKALLFAGLLSLATPMMTSCVKQDVDVELDMKMLADMVSKLDALIGEIQALKAQVAAGDSAKQVKLDQLIQIATNIYSKIAHLDNTTDANSAALNEILANQETIINLMQKNDSSEAEAEARALFFEYLNQFKAGLITLTEFIAKIEGHVANIDANLAQLLKEYRANAKYQNKALLMTMLYAQQTAANTSETAVGIALLNEKVDKMNKSVDSILTYMPTAVARLEDIVNAVDKNTDAVKDAKEALLSMGYTAMQLQKMSDAQILAELKKQTATQNAILADVRALKNKFDAGLIDSSEYLKEIINLLKGMKDDIAGLTLAVVDLNNTVKLSADKTDKALQALLDINRHSDYKLQVLVEAHAAEAADREAFKAGFDELLAVVKNIDGTTTSIYNFLKDQGLSKDEIEKLFKMLNDNQAARNEALIDANNANKDDIINAINNFMKDVLAKDDAMLKNQEIIIDKLDLIAENIRKGQGGSEVDLTKLEKQLADILAAIRAIPTSIPNYTDILNKIYDKIGDIKCTCDCQGDHDNNEGIIGEINDIINGING